MVRRSVSSKSKMCELMPFISDALSTSRRSLRPSTDACAGPLKGFRARIAISTVSCRLPPTAHPVQFKTVRKASRRIAAGTSSFREETAHAARRRVTSRAGAPADCGGSAEETDAAAPPTTEARRKRRLSIPPFLIPQLWLNHGRRRVVYGLSRNLSRKWKSDTPMIEFNSASMSVRCQSNAIGRLSSARTITQYNTWWKQ